MARSKRISFLASLLKGYDTVVDIGCDHGLVLKEAFEQAYIRCAIASDINEKPLVQAQKNLKNHPVKYVLSDGFSHIKDSYNAVVIAGMGSFLIAQILEKAPQNADVTYVLQANDKIEFLRKFLSKNAFEITDEYVVFDKHYYVVIIVRRGKMDLLESDLLLGPKLKMKPESASYYAYKVRQIKRIYEKTDAKRQKELDQMLIIYDNM